MRPGEVAIVLALSEGTLDKAHVRLRNEFPVGPFRRACCAGLSLS